MLPNIEIEMDIEIPTKQNKTNTFGTECQVRREMLNLMSYSFPFLFILFAKDVSPYKKYELYSHLFPSSLFLCFH